MTITFIHCGFHAAIESTHFAAGACMVVTFKLDGRMTDVVLFRKHGVERL
ncbi:MAG: hypothetical protein ABI406_18630 [Ktedonobacteraceae bacterium]